MANKLAAKKDLRKSKKSYLINKMTLKKIKTARKKYLAFVEGNKIEEAKQQFSLTQSILAKAAKKNIIHWKKAARLTAKMSAKLNKPFQATASNVN